MWQKMKEKNHSPLVYQLQFSNVLSRRGTEKTTYTFSQTNANDLKRNLYLCSGATPPCHDRSSCYRNKAMNNKYLILAARTISALFNPFYLPTVAVTLLLMFSYLNQLDNHYRLAFAGIVVIFTWIFPLIAIYLYRRINGWTSHQMSRRERRFVPYIINIVCYGSLYILMRSLHIPTFLSTVVMSALLLQMVCALTNVWIKISIHAAASGAVVGMLMAFSLVFHFNAIAWLCLSILLSGAVCSSRMILKVHNYRELFFGVIIGLVCGWAVVYFI